MTAERLIAAARRLSAELDTLRFSVPVSHVYNPLDYAWAPHEAYLRRYGNGTRRVLFVGMNPGPYGMVQTGVPFGEVALVRDWLGIEAPVGQPAMINPAKPVQGFSCPRSEVSGARLWGLFKARFDHAEAFFDEHFVANWCPLAFFAEGRNLTPDKLATVEAAPLAAACDAHLATVIDCLQPDWLIGVGAFAEARIRAVCPERKHGVGRVLHPSPASPAANRGWAAAATAQLEALGVWSQEGRAVRRRSSHQA